ncbi:MAG: ABC transporter substrate-binding protein [Deltaproteobacteria bacterium]|jgi:putative ABC transport system substrate-binding protein|nr:ABC transporter substrate-binding protein [Deltaproteobacteria bacterium]
MKKLLSSLFCSALVLAAVPVLAATISIHQLVEHPSLDAAAKGFQDAVTEAGIEATFNVHNAQNNSATSQQIVNQILGENPDLVLAISTPSAQHVANKIKDIPILFTAVTDPVAAQLVASLEAPGGNVTGTSDMSPLAEQIDLVKEIQPDVKNIGVIYNSGEVNSVVQIDVIKAACEKSGLNLIEAVAANNAGVYQAAQSLVGKVDAIFLPTDNTVISSYESVLRVAGDHNIPVYPAEADSLAKGGTASLSLDYYQLGRQTGAMAVKILNDKVKPADLPVETQQDFKLIVNQGFVNKISQTIPQTVMDRAQEVLQ